jgi:hypothetical protein
MAQERVPGSLTEVRGTVRYLAAFSAPSADLRR